MCKSVIHYSRDGVRELGVQKVFTGTKRDNGLGR